MYVLPSGSNLEQPGLALKLLCELHGSENRFVMFPLYAPLGLQRVFVANRSLPIQYALQSYDIANSRSVTSMLEFPSTFGTRCWWHQRRNPSDFYGMDFRLGIMVTKLDPESDEDERQFAIVRY